MFANSYSQLERLKVTDEDLERAHDITQERVEDVNDQAIDDDPSSSDENDDEELGVAAMD